MSKVVHVDRDNLTVDNTTTETDIFEFDFYEFMKIKNDPSLFRGEYYQGFKLNIGGGLSENVGGTPSFTFKSYVNDVWISDLVISDVTGGPSLRYEVVGLLRPGENLIIGMSTLCEDEGPVSMFRSERNAVVSVADDFVLRSTITMSEAAVGLAVARNMAYLETL